MSSKKYHVGLVTVDVGFTYWAMLVQGARDRAVELGIELSFKSVASPGEQLAMIKELSNLALDAFIIGPHDGTDPRLASTVEDIRAMNIPVITTGTEILNAQVTSAIGTNNFKGGGTAATYLINQLGGKGNIILVDAPQQLPRIEGFRQVTDSHPNCQIVFEAQGDWSTASSAQIVREGLSLYPDVSGIYTANDTMALGAVEAVMEMELSDKITVVGFDGLPEALVAIQEGKMGATVNQLPAVIGRLAIDTVWQVLNGESVPSSQIIEAELITTENLQASFIEVVNLLPKVLQGLSTSNKELSTVNTTLEQEIAERKLAETELNNYRHHLEELVANRTQRLEVIASISEKLSAILDLESLLTELVNQIKVNFNYYHTHIYMLDEANENLIVVAGTGEAGVEMKQQSHSIPLSAPTSLVARAARRGEVVRIDNVREAGDWLSNPLLPDTYSEMAVPIIWEGQVVGVLDVQENEIGGLDEGDASLLRSLAGHVAVALTNARLFTRTEQALAEAQAVQQQYIQQAWNKVHKTQNQEYYYDRPGLSSLPEETRLQAEQLAQTKERPTLVALSENGKGPKSLIAPVILGGQTIGAFQLHQTQDDNLTYNWTDDDLTLIETILDQVAQTAENLRLFEETRERFSFEQLVGDVTYRIRQSPNLESLAQTATEVISEVLGASGGSIRIGLADSTQQASNKIHDESQPHNQNGNLS